jgi:hypothetical protein
MVSEGGETGTQGGREATGTEKTEKQGKQRNGQQTRQGDGEEFGGGSWQ